MSKVALEFRCLNHYSSLWLMIICLRIVQSYDIAQKRWFMTGAWNYDHCITCVVVLSWFTNLPSWFPTRKINGRRWIHLTIAIFNDQIIFLISMVTNLIANNHVWSFDDIDVTEILVPIVILSWGLPKLVLRFMCTCI